MDYTPPPGSQDPNAKYVTGVPGQVKGSPVPAEAVENPQREIVEVIAQAGLEPSNEDLTQLAKAIALLISKGRQSLEPYESAPAALGVASPGTSEKYARGDHVHPNNQNGGYNTRIVLTTSGTYTAPVTGWYKVTCIGGGGGGGAGGNADGTGNYGGAGGKQGGTTTFGTISAIGGSGGGGGGSYPSQGGNSGGGGGGAGVVSTDYMYLSVNQQVAYTVGAGGARGTGSSGLQYMGSAGTGPASGRQSYPSFGGMGAAGACNGSNAMGVSTAGEPGPGGAGGLNGTGYGGGGGGGAGNEGTRFAQTCPGGSAGDGASYGAGTTNSTTVGGAGGDGGKGAIILEYFNPEKTV